MLPGSLVEGSAATKSSRQIGQVGWSRAVGRYEKARTMAGVGRASGAGDDDRLSELDAMSFAVL